MLVGRVMAMGVGFLTQVIVVRHLAKSDYGAFAYGVSAALLLQSVLALGADRIDTRFLAQYEHQRDHARLLGVIVFEAATVLALGTAASPRYGCFASRSKARRGCERGDRAYSLP